MNAKSIKKQVLETLSEKIREQQRTGTKHYYFMYFSVTFKEGSFVYLMDTRCHDCAIERFERDMKDCTNSLSSIEVSDFIFDYDL